MSPHLVTAPADETYGSLEPRLVEADPSTATSLSAQQASDLLDWASAGRTPDPSPVLGPLAAHPTSAAQGPPTLLGCSDRTDGGRRRARSQQPRSHSSRPAALRPSRRIPGNRAVDAGELLHH